MNDYVGNAYNSNDVGTTPECILNLCWAKSGGCIANQCHVHSGNCIQLACVIDCDGYGGAVKV